MSKEQGRGGSVVVCECGHPVDDHVASGWGPHTVCVVKLDTFPHGGWYGVCPCVRRDVNDA